MEIKDYATYRQEEVERLYASVGWTNYTEHPDVLAFAYHHSLCILGAYESDVLVGLIRAVGDGASILFIQDIIVHPDYQRKGIGTALLKEMMQRYANVYQMELLTDNTEKTVAFYTSLGFVPAEAYNCIGMIKFGEKSCLNKEPP